MLRCHSCEQKQKNKKMIDKEEPVEEKWKIFLFGLLGFFVPIAGLAVYLAMKENYPKLSIAAGIGALCNVVGFVLLFLFLIFATLF